MPDKVKNHTHHTPRVYLRRFGTPDEMLIAERPGKQAAKPIPVPEVGVRRRFYTVELSDGTHSNEIEDKLALLEGKSSMRSARSTTRPSLSISRPK